MGLRSRGTDEWPTPSLTLAPSALRDVDADGSPADLAAARTALDWVEEVMTRPHPDLGRDGVVCPFVEPSLRRDHLTVVVHPEVDGSRVAPLRQAIERHATEMAAQTSDLTTRATLIVLPNIPPAGQRTLDNVHRLMKSWLAERALMIAPFHSRSTTRGTRNEAFQLSSPVPFYALRHMAVHDVLFVQSKKSWFAAFYARYADTFHAGRVHDPALTQAFETAEGRWKRSLGR